MKIHHQTKKTAQYDFEFYPYEIGCLMDCLNREIKIAREDGEEPRKDTLIGIYIELEKASKEMEKILKNKPPRMAVYFLVFN